MAATGEYQEWIEGSEVNVTQNAVAHLRSMAPEMTVTPASVEFALLQSHAVQVGPVIAAYQRLPGRVIDHLMRLSGLRRYEGRYAEGRVRVTVNAAASRVIVPAGTVLRHYLAASNEIREFVTVEDVLVLPAESVVGEARVRATTTGTEHNGLPVGAALDTVDAFFMDVDRFEVSESPRGGEGLESDESWNERSRAQLERQVSTLVTADQMRSAALTREEVGRAYVLNLHNPSAPTVEAPGHVTVVVTDTSGLSLSLQAHSALEDWFLDQVVAGLQIHVISPTYTTVDPVVKVEAAPGATLSTVEVGVRDALAQWINPATWDWWPEITPFDYVSTLDDVPGVARVLEAPAKLTLTGKAPLPRLGNVTVTVEPSSRGGV